MSEATPLARIIAARVQAQGPLTLAEFMAECLLHPEHGYYVTREPFGQTGDFITAPEISQMFGELLGLCLAQYWLDLGGPAPFILAEVGPGRGTLMADVLRATRGVPGFHAALRLHLVEASPRLRALQRERLPGWQVEWLAQVEELPQEAPLFLLANEFFDALPIRQFTRIGAHWAETMVGLSPEGRLQLGRSPAAPLVALAHRSDVAEGGIVEICPAAAPIAAAIGTRIARNGGLALIIDYGGWRSLGDTFQALRAHEPVDPLATPGEADLTAHVDFEAIARAAAPARAHFTTQGHLLRQLGLDARAEQLARNLAGEALRQHLAAARRLTAATEMGTLFKALALTAPGAPHPAGFPPTGQ